MSDFSATDVAFSGFRFVRQHPRTVALWAVVQLLVSVVLGCVLVVFGGPLIGQMQALEASGQQDPAAALALFAQFLPILGLIILFCLIFYPVLYAAISRAGLQPGEDRAGYLRLGGDEGRQLLLFLLVAGISIGAEIAGILLIVVPTLALGLTEGGLANLVHALSGLALTVVFVFCSVRLSLCSPLTFDRRRVDLFGSWTLTRGRFWKIFGAYVLVLGLCLVVFLLTMLVDVALVAAVSGGLRGSSAAFKSDFSSLSAYFALPRAITIVVGAVAAAVIWPVVLMPPVEIYKALRPSRL